MKSLKARIIWLSVLKLGCGALFASYFMRDLFIPTLNAFSDDITRNPWQFLLDNAVPHAFPYGPFMLYPMSLPFVLLGWMLPGDWMNATWAHLLLARLPLFAADLGIGVLLLRFLDRGQERAMNLWWSSPVIFYITYIHGQLDLIPMAYLVASLAFLFKRRYLISCLVLGLGIACKIHLIVALPFILVYIYRNEVSWRKSLQAAVIVFLTYAAGLLPWGLNQGFQKMVFGSKEQMRLFAVGFDYGAHLKLFLAPLIIGLLFLRFAIYKKVNKEILMMFLGLTYTTMITLLPPAHGYYLWPLPFVLYFFAKQTEYSRAPLWAFNATCLAYLILGHDSTFFDSLRLISGAAAALGAPVTLLENPDLANSILFSGMQISILTMAFMMYSYGVQSNIFYRPKLRPVMIGISGDSGAGKKTARNILADVMGWANILTVEGDDAHRWERGHPMWRATSHLDPKANDLYLQLEHARQLGEGYGIRRVRYDHKSGKFADPQAVSPARFIFFVGLHTFYMKRMRELLDIKIFMDTDETLRRQWKTARDTRERGYAQNEVEKQMLTRIEDAKRYVEPQKSFADMLVRYQPAPGANSGQAPLNIEIEVDNSVNLAPLLDELRLVATLDIKAHNSPDLTHQAIRANGAIARDEIARAARRSIPQLQELVAAQPLWRENYEGVLQLVFLVLLQDLLQSKPQLAVSTLF